MLSSCFFSLVFGSSERKLQEDFPETAGKNTEACLWSINIFNDSSFTHFLEFLKICPKSFHFFAKMIDLCLLTEKNQTLKGVIGRNIALWQNLWVGVGRFERPSSSARASLALCGRFYQFRSPYSWITMRRALRKRRVLDFVPSYLNRVKQICSPGSMYRKTQYHLTELCLQTHALVKLLLNVMKELSWRNFSQT